ncbi:hypothetical protein HRbin40_02240 [bacterium HR40]|nr:hypothetical protein HRbin40_02240 [bacterium HR40]
MSAAACSIPVTGRLPQVRLAAVALALAVLGGLLAWRAAGERQLALYGVGLLLGLSLYHASFGFTSAWRRLVVEGDGRGLRAQLVMLAVAVLLFFPALAEGELFGRPVSGFVAPAGTSVAIGAFLFGLGMQLGGGCASGTLYAVGGGSTRMIVTLFFFILGSVIATAHLPFWHSLPALEPFSFVEALGLLPALVLHLGLFALIFALSLLVERRRHGHILENPRLAWHPLRGPWPIWAGAVALALLNFATLALAGRPWGITSAFALWGAKLFDAVGIGVREWEWWRNQQTLLELDLWQDITSVMDFGIMIGAFLAASLAGEFRPGWRVPPRVLLAAALGGLLLGYGARLAFGCNIGAYFSGIASGSLHGWLWPVAALAGTAVGVRLRPRFGLSNP